MALLFAACGGSGGVGAHATVATRNPTSGAANRSGSSTTVQPGTSTSTTGTTTAGSAVPATAGISTPTVTIAGWTGREPARIYFSGDAGNVATGLTWAVWNDSGAVGHGTRQELSCVPDCAQGTSTAYAVTLTLGSPVDGRFTTLVEQTADGRGTVDTFDAPDLGQGVCATDQEASCVFLGG